jgi:2-keto-4-pentenoate hydratase/2-oxohepta-3-ene-1,7-dioic acid hydratase in catechol pathway
MPDYKLLTYADKNRQPRAGLLIDDRIIDLDSALRSHAKSSGKPATFSASSVADVLRDWTKARPVLNAIARSGPGRGVRSTPLKGTRLLAPLPDLGLIYCAGANYFDHAAEVGLNVVKSKVKPFFFIKSGAAITAPNTTVRLPKWSKKVDWEAEIAFIVGRTARNVRRADALKYVAGYTILNDVSARDHARRDDWPFTYDWLQHKSFDTSAPMGPWITPASQIADPQKLKIDLWVNDVHEQDTSSKQMIFTVAEQIAALSKQLTLRPGDVVATGTGGGVGMPQNRFLSPGDRIRITIEGLGTLRNTVAAGK